MMKHFISTAVLTILISLHSNAEFKNGYKNPHDLLNSLAIKFEHIEIKNVCNIINQIDRSALGDQNLLTGEPFANEPGAAFLSYWNNCLTEYFSAVSNYSSASTPEKLKIDKFLKEIFATNLNTIGYGSVLEAALMQRLPQDLQKQEALTDRLIYWALGSDEEILAYGKITDLQQFKADFRNFLVNINKNNTTYYSFAVNAIKELLKRDEFLTYL